MMLSFFSAYMVQRRPSCSQVQTLMYSIYKIKFWRSFTPLPSVTQLALAPIRNTTTITTSYQHMPMLLALPTRAMLRVHVKTPTYIFSSSLGEYNTLLIQKDRYYAYSLKCYIFALFL
jgi:hypothetical protein